MVAPFQTSGNVGDIAGAQVRGGTTPVTAVSDAVASVVKSVVPHIIQAREDDITEGVNNKIQAVSEALKATRFPSLQKSMFSEEALANPNVSAALKEFTLIQDAAVNGVLPSRYALERLEIIQNNAIRLSPEFEAEIRGAMIDATGQDPTKTLFNQLISPASKKQTAQQKLDERLFLQAGEIGRTVPEVVAMNFVKAQNEIQLQGFELSAKQGAYTVNTAGAELVNRGNDIITNVMNQMMKANVAGIPISVEMENELIALVKGGFGNASATVQAHMQGLNVTGSQITAILAPAKVQLENTIAMIKDGALAKVLDQHSDVVVADATHTWLNNEEYGNIFAVMKGPGLFEFMKFKTQYAGKAEKLLKVINAEAGSLFEADQIMKQASKVGDGADLSGIVKQARVVAAVAGMGNVGAGEEYQMKSTADVVKYNGPELAWTSFNNRGMTNAVHESTRLKAAFLNMQVATTEALGQELLTLASNPDVDFDLLKLNEAGELTYTVPTSQANTRGQSGTASVATANVLAYVKRYNRANLISATYSGAGILPPTRYTNSTSYWNSVRKLAADAGVQKFETGPKKVIIGADGKLQFAGSN